jgi:hypothetical protein
MYPLGSGFLKGLNFSDKRLFPARSFFPYTKGWCYRHILKLAESKKMAEFLEI